LASNQAISSSRAKPLSARRVMRVFRQRPRICATMAVIASTAPALPSKFARRSLAKEAADEKYFANDILNRENDRRLVDNIDSVTGVANIAREYIFTPLSQHCGPWS
jgi:hypothetical protein